MAATPNTTSSAQQAASLREIEPIAGVLSAQLGAMTARSEVKHAHGFVSSASIGTH